MRDEFEDITRALRSLSVRKPLRNRDLERAKELMVNLRKMGFTNREISELTEGGWSENTVKAYTRGTVVSNPRPKEDAMRTLTQLISRGLTLDDVERTLSLNKILDIRGVSLEDVASLLESTESSSIHINDLVEMRVDLERAGLTLLDLNSALSYKRELEAAGFTINALKGLSQASKKYGGQLKVLEAIGEYASIKAIEARAQKIASETKKHEKQLTSLKSTLNKLEQDEKRIEGALNRHRSLLAQGFDENALSQLQAASQKYGGVNSVLAAVNQYNSLNSLKAQLERYNQEITAADSNLKKLQADYAHLKTVTAMCNTLLYEYSYSIAAITDIYKVAGKYGDPIKVMEALDKYGEIKKIEKEITIQNRVKEKGKTEIEEMVTRVGELKAQTEELNTAISSKLQISTEIDESVDAMKTALEEATRKIDDRCQQTLRTQHEESMKYAEKLGELKEDAGRFEEMLRLARIVNAAIKYPSEAGTVPLGYPILMLDAVASILKAKRVNPVVIPIRSIREKYRPDSGLELMEIINWAINGLKNEALTTREWGVKI